MARYDYIHSFALKLYARRNDKVSQEYQKQKLAYENGEMTKEQFVIANNDLKTRLVKPEEIDTKTYEDELELVERWDFTDIQNQYSYERYEREKVIRKNEELTELVRKKEEQHDNDEKHRVVLQGELDKKEEQISGMNKDLENKDKKISLLEEEIRMRKEKDAEIERIKAENKKLVRKIIAIIIVTIVIICLLVLVIKYVIGSYSNSKFASAIGAIFTTLSCLGIFGIIIKWIYKRISRGNEENKGVTAE